MDYEKAYKEAIERCKSWMRGEHPEYFTEAQKAGEFIFPELKESEDEKIIRTLKEIVNWGCAKNISVKNNVELKDCLAWLEKQGEQKLIEQDTEVHDLWVYIREWNDKFGRLPKDEDELAVCIDYVMKRQKPTDNYCQENCKGYRDTGGKCFADGECEAKKKAKQKSFWSEEDEKMYQSIIDDTVQKYLLDGNQFAWLKSIKDRVQPQPKQEWSEEDELMLESTIQSLRLTNGAAQMKIDWLKSLKPNHWKPSEEQLIALKNVIIGKRGPLYDLYFNLEKL